jgi:hypothetical protein
MRCQCDICQVTFHIKYELYEFHNEFAYYCKDCYDEYLEELYEQYLDSLKTLNNSNSNNSTSKKNNKNNNKKNSKRNSNSNMSSNKDDQNSTKNKKPKQLSQREIEKILDEELEKYFADNSNTNTNQNGKPKKENQPNVRFIPMKSNEFFEILKAIGQDMDELEKSNPTGKEGIETSPDVSQYKFEWIGDEVCGIKDLIRLGEEYSPEKQIQTNLDLWRLNKCVPALKELDAMIGMDTVKDSIFYQIVFHLQKLDNENKDMHHTVIKGPPGVGKTQLTHIIAKIYKALGFLKTDKVISVKRDDLVAGYVGQTAIKTKKKLEEALGGVLLIDEAYAFGQGDGKDSFSKEAIDLLTSYLSEHGHEFICIIAGYKEALEKRFFSLNEGLKRRFNINYEIEGYKPTECMEIFKKIIKDNEWNYNGEDVKTDKFFSENKEAFPHFGGDMLTLFAFCKKSHSRRLLKIKTLEELNSSRKNISYEDLKDGYDLFMKSKCEGGEGGKFDKPPMWMYT